MSEDIETKLHREGLTLTPIKTRAYAYMIDDFLISMLVFISFPSIFDSTLSNEEIISMVQSILFEVMLIKILYQSIFVTLYGATVGKIVMKIKVVEADTLDKPRFAVALNRAVFRIISQLFYGLGFLWGFFNPTRQTLHDKTARTLVINA